MTSELILSRRDLDFLLFDWLQVESLTQCPHFAGQDRFDYTSVLDIYEKLATELFAPHNKKNDSHEPSFDGERVTVNPEVGVALRAFADAGLVSAAFPEEWNGMSLPSTVERAGMAYLLAANPGTAGYAFLTIANANLLIAHGERERVSHYVEAMSEGRCFGTMCLSEPQAGSSLADIRTRAVPTGDGRYRLFGNKMWISGGDHEISDNIVHLVLAKIPDENGRLPAGVQGISLFTVPRKLTGADGQPGERNDVVLAGINHKMGNRGTVNCLLNFGEGRFRPEGEAGALGEIVGEAGKGLAYMFHMMNEARISVGLGAAALGYTGYLHALDYAKTRLQGRPRTERDPTVEQVPIIRHADVRRMLLAQKAYASGALALCLYAARLSDDIHSQESAHARDEAQCLLDLLTPVVKSWSSQWGLEANDLAIQVHGGYGYTREYNVEQFYRDNRLNPIHEGTTGVQALDLLGRKTRMNGGVAMGVLERRLASTVSRALAIQSLREHASKLEWVWERICMVTHKLHRLEDGELQLANSTAYLDAFGHVVVGWLWLDQAVVAATLASGPSASDFHRGKLAACDYFFGWEMPKVAAWLAVLNPVETTPLNMPEQWF
ncbi:acyl-CoA dehydrogenase [Burkholderia cepacia]|uniref:acyl-CoA dehydrogenase n=1 Tax=Burkholderia cepacia TaxID=292 RepID=UPI002019FEAD|nr:acyl-CoA dehydrogenase [Burkholderia cepacia]UQO37843.1 acyl-CoA dehydrogenase [Burkholderia cepacia]UQO52181.1 acyl-CoA dehydrogenase [Burkholderia cepacia]UQP06328.1 acyl-CoA dehydrogenase [Burkholderia cepacia]